MTKMGKLAKMRIWGRYKIDVKRDKDNDDKAKEPRDEIEKDDIRRYAFGSISKKHNKGYEEKDRELDDNGDCLYEHLV